MATVRRLAAILAVDVVGYSKLMGEDEVGTLGAVNARLEASRRLIAERGGRLVKTMGDGLLLEFPSVVAATECAIDIQGLMAQLNAAAPDSKPLLYRIGVHLGDVIVEDEDIFGEGVNIAARLEGICAPGGVALSGAAYEHVRGRVEAEFSDLGEQALKNIARPVRVFALGGAGAAASTAAPRLSIVVLPFANLGADSAQDYFVDGVTDSLTTDLSKLPGFFVISRNSAFSYKGKPIDIKQIGRDLGVRYALEGSIQRSGPRMRVNVQLIDAESGAHLWAERFDKPIADLFDMQDEIVARLAHQLDIQVVTAEAVRARRAANPDAMDHYFQGCALLYKGGVIETYEQAEAHLDRALALAPGFIDARVNKCLIDVTVAGALMSDDRAARLARAEATAREIVKSRPDNALAHLALGIAYSLTNRQTEAIVELERSQALDQNLAQARGQIALCKYFVGRFEEVEADVSEALRLSPRDMIAGYWATYVGSAKLALRREAEAVVWFNRALDLNADFPVTHFLKAAALALMGQVDEAKGAIRHGLDLDPRFTIVRFLIGMASDHPDVVIARERAIEGLRKAGLPEA